MTAVRTVHPRSDPVTAIVSFLGERTAKRRRKMRLIPISAGTTATESAANMIPLSRAMKRNAMMMVEGSVPMIPPVFVPYFSAMMVTRITTSADKAKGMIVWYSREYSMEPWDASWFLNISFFVHSENYIYQFVISTKL